MPSSFTPSLRLVLPVTGELQGAWGDAVNTGITSLVDAAIAGTADVAMTDADRTLTAVNEAADEARQMFINLTGTLTAPRNVICPDVSKLYFVQNGTDAVVTFKTSAGTGVSIPVGGRAALYCDGTNVVPALDVGDVTLAATQTLTNKTIAFEDNTLTDVAGTTATQTLTNKTIAFADNTLTDVVGTTATQTLTNKTIDANLNTLLNLPEPAPFSNNTALAQVHAIALSF